MVNCNTRLVSKHFQLLLGKVLTFLETKVYYSVII